MILTLLSDFGNKDYYVALAKGLLLKHIQQVQLVDLSHEVKPYNKLQCSYFLKSSYSYFPERTLHLSLFDILKNFPADLIIANVNGQFILSSDNGLIPLTFPQDDISYYRVPTQAKSYVDWIEKVAIFIRHWKKQNWDIHSLTPTEPQIDYQIIAPIVSEDTIDCHIIHIDRYGNIILNITKELFEENRKERNFEIGISRYEVITKISEDYKEVSEGNPVCIFNSAGLMEIAINKGAAAQLFGWDLKQNQKITYQTIKIKFL